MNKKKKILTVPLDWGLGHATRCIPLITEFLQNDCEVIIAGNTITNSLLKEEFPHLRYELIDGYNIQYASSKILLPFIILKQIPKIVNSIKKEHKWLNDFVKDNEIDIVISDNRYGLFHKTIQTIFITHQLQIQIPHAKIIEKIVNKINHFYIKKFSYCWVPDYPEHTLSGKLSIHNSLKNVEYIGILSRFINNKNTIPTNDILFLISGPEPLRTLFENKIIDEFSNTNYSKTIVRGLPTISEKIQINGFTIYNHLSKNDLQSIIISSKFIVCRSGYSTIMDLIKLNKNALLIPTPGQTEQEYLAQLLKEKNIFFTANQKENILIAFNKYFINSLHKTINIETELCKQVIKKFVNSIS